MKTLSFLPISASFEQKKRISAVLPGYASITNNLVKSNSIYSII